MSETDSASFWKGLRPEARACLATRDYAAGDLASWLDSGRAEARDLISDSLPAELAIPGVEVFHRRVFQQRYRG